MQSSVRPVKKPRYDVIYSLDTALLVQILSFVDLNDVIRCRWVASRFRTATDAWIAQTDSLQFSALALPKDSAAVARTKQDDVVRFLLSQWTAFNNKNLQYLELAGLTHLQTGLRALRGEHPCTNFPHLCIHTLDLSRCPRFEGIFGFSSTQLQHLFLSGCQRFNMACLPGVVQRFPKLKTLHIDGCSQEINSIDCLRNLPLKSLDISGLDRIFASLDTLRCFPQLEYFAAVGCRRFRLDASGYSTVRQHDRRQPATPPPSWNSKLKVVNLNDIGSPRTNATIGSLTVLAKAAQWQLEEVHLRSCQNIASEELQLLLRTSGPTLRCLNLFSCAVNDSVLSGIGQHCRNLVELDISFATGRHLNLQSLTHCTELRALRMVQVDFDESKLHPNFFASFDKLLVWTASHPKGVLHKTYACPQSLVEYDVEGNSLSFSSCPMTSLVVVNNRRRQCVSNRSSENGRCLAAVHSQRCQAQLGVELQPMWNCIDCNLVATFNRAMCFACAKQCHSGHTKHFAGYCRFYCDCAFGYSRTDCKAL